MRPQVHGVFVAYCNYAAPDYGGSRLIAPDGREICGPPPAPAAFDQFRFERAAGSAFDDGAYDAGGKRPAADAAPRRNGSFAVSPDPPSALVGDLGTSLRHQLDWRRGSRANFVRAFQVDDADDDDGGETVADVEVYYINNSRFEKLR